MNDQVTNSNLYWSSLEAENIFANLSTQCALIQTMFTFHGVIFSILMGLFMSLTITFATTLSRIGFSHDLVAQWMAVWAVAYPVAIVCIILYRPLVTKITTHLTTYFLK